LKLPKSLGDVIRSKREFLGRGSREFSIRKVAARAEISSTYLIQLEEDRISSPSESVLKNLAEELNLDARGLILSTGQIPSDIGDTIRSRPEELSEILLTLGKITEESYLSSAVQEFRESANDWSHEGLKDELEQNIEEYVTQGSMPDVPIPNNPGPQETGQWGQDMAQRIFEGLGFNVELNEEFPTNSNALLVSRKSLVPDKMVQFLLLPKTSKTSRQIRLGGREFVANRRDGEFYIAFLPKAGESSVFRDPEIFLIPANVARDDGLLVTDVYEARGGKSAGIIIKDVEREPHKSIIARWRRCFLLPQALDWLPR
jgi:transcriptional regulator with XRE-family HTH domain